MKAVIAVGAFMAGRSLRANDPQGWFLIALAVIAAIAAIWLLGVIVASWMKHHY
jgi:CDP-diglyceride synthetase